MPLDPAEQNYDEHPVPSAAGRRTFMTLASGAALAGAAGAVLAASPAASAATTSAARPVTATAAGDGDHHPIEHLTQIPGLTSFPYTSLVVAGGGKMIALTGQMAQDAKGNLVSDDPLAQCRQVFANITTALGAVGAGPRNVLRLDVWLLDLAADIGALRTAYHEWTGPETPPALTLVQAAGLFIPGARVQIDALAVV